ncbi:MAG: SRPBCC domain-containing protein [Bacteroidales bacterium]|nr:SRPBCC domain-containing protein [Bacteroidales bacterium]
MPKTFKTRIKLGASAEDVYSALTNPFALELWTGYPAKMSTEVGSEFELWEGDICGQNLEFEPNRLVKQEWYFGEQTEKSIVTMKIFANGAEKSTLDVEQTNIPDEDFDDLTEGWRDTYLAALKQFLEEGDD